MTSRNRRSSNVIQPEAVWIYRVKILSQMLQDLESKAVYDYVASHKGVCALEHDGFVSYEEVTDWFYPSLMIEKMRYGASLSKLMLALSL